MIFLSVADYLRLMAIILFTLAASWFGMQAIHELGHVLAAWLTGGRVERVVLNPLTISRTDLAANPHPLIVAWSGPTLGALAPFLLWVAVGRAANHGNPPRSSGLFQFLQFFAGFCLLANGLYISLGSFDNIGDAGDLLRHGSPLWHLWLFGALTAPLGLYLWHKLGPPYSASDATS